MREYWNQLSNSVHTFAPIIDNRMPTKLMVKATKAVIAVYAPLQNLGFCISLLCCQDILAAITSLPYVIAIDLDVMLLWFLAKCFGFCRLYEIAILNPFIWTTLMLITPTSWNPILAVGAMLSSAVLSILLVSKWYYNKPNLIITE